MTVAAAENHVNATLGDIIVIGSRRYEVVDDREGGLALEPAVGTAAEQLRRDRGARRLTPGEFDELFGHLSSDQEG